MRLCFISLINARSSHCHDHHEMIPRVVPVGADVQMPIRNFLAWTFSWTLSQSEVSKLSAIIAVAGCLKAGIKEFDQNECEKSKTKNISFVSKDISININDGWENGKVFLENDRLAYGLEYTSTIDVLIRTQEDGRTLTSAMKGSGKKSLQKQNTGWYGVRTYFNRFYKGRPLRICFY